MFPYTLILVAQLLLNAIAILNEERFLTRIGLSSSAVALSAQQQQHSNYYDTGAVAQGPSIRARIVDLISAVRMLLRLPLIGLNLIVIFYYLLL
ncbi:Yos1-like protein, partial [Ramicandelaber brevisporus]